MNIFLDLDGTLLDSRLRLYKLFVELCPGISIGFDEYWSKKRKKISNEQILESIGYNIDIPNFQRHWLERIESEYLLVNDKPFEGVSLLLSEWCRNYNLYLVTARQSAPLVDWQLERVGLFHYFKQILVTKQHYSKVELIRQSINTSANDVFIGDTGIDVNTAKELGIISIAVLSGFREREVLASYYPDYIFEYLTDVNIERLDKLNL